MVVDLSLLGPGAQTLVKKVADGEVNIDADIRDLTVDDWAVIVKTFDEWPFAPEVRAVLNTVYQSLTRLLSHLQDLSIHESLGGR